MGTRKRGRKIRAENNRFKKWLKTSEIMVATMKSASRATKDFADIMSGVDFGYSLDRNCFVARYNQTFCFGDSEEAAKIDLDSKINR